jgi:glyoxylase-like metal-dependent hydrolase (beta-lactamase superfamily II)
VGVDDVAPDVTRIVMRAGGGVAGQPVCAYLVGRRRLVLVDPGDPTGPALERCLDAAAGRDGAIVAIALTSVDPDHHAGAEALAERLGVPVFAGPGAQRRLPYVIEEVADDQIIEHGDALLRVLAAPGLGPEHVALVVGDGSAVLTGDLDGLRGARSIFGPVDEATWRASRARVDELPSEWPRLAAHESDQGS